MFPLPEKCSIERHINHSERIFRKTNAHPWPGAYIIISLSIQIKVTAISPPHGDRARTLLATISLQMSPTFPTTSIHSTVNKATHDSRAL